MSATTNVIPDYRDWTAVRWSKTYKVVRNLRQRIFWATKVGDFKKVKQLQKLMLRSTSNIVTSVRRVTQVNAGKNTPGVDKVLVKTPEERTKLLKELMEYTPWRAKPVKRVYIPKHNGKWRPLGIPTIKDRAMQAIVKNALEPFWEAKFEGISYGFRPGRSCHDATAKIFLFANPKGRKRWILDADIKGAFDNIDHNFLLKRIEKYQFPAMELIKQWLKAGVMEEGRYIDANSGTPQGGVSMPPTILHNWDLSSGR
ncbi:MAG TPA: reverse transcriptase domain-containing protein [Candidatus Competibacteraceae bacterium]|nr:reverse transcriptase domain-containing protein [Candidatus Competibacteraceae bacterium]